MPLRPVGHQTNEVVLDNDDPGVTFVGSWTNSTRNRLLRQHAGDVPYRFASTSATETAYARYQPNIPQAGFYPVYAWTRSRQRSGRPISSTACITRAASRK